MAYISNLKYVHRDLAARNCFLDHDYKTVKVADFGLSRDVYESDYYRQRSRCEVPWKWMSPESFSNGVSNHETDVWSFGVVMWELMTRGLMPYKGLNSSDIVNYLFEGNRLPCPSHCPVILYEMMLKCWNLNPKQRPTFDQLVDQVKSVIIILERKLDENVKVESTKNKLVYTKYPVKKFYVNMNKSMVKNFK
jgi:serine/threonine protein kinase